MATNKSPVQQIPYDMESEHASVGGVLMDSRRLIDLLAIVQPEDLFILRTRYVLEAMVSLQERHEPIDLLTVSKELENRGKLGEVGGDAYLATLIGSCPDPGNVEHYARKVAARAYDRRLLEAGDKIKTLALKPGMNTDNKQSEIEAIIAATDRGEENEVVTLYDSMKRYMDYISSTARMGDGVTGLATGFTEWDNLLDGLQEGSLNLVAARPGMGKTSLLLAVALYVAKCGGHVYIWSGEMPEKQIRERITSIETGLPSRVLRRGLRPNGMTPERWQRFGKEAYAIGQLPIYIDDEGGITPAKLEARAQRIARRRTGGLALIVADYIGLMNPGVRKENRDKELGYISRRLKEIAHIAPVLCAAQLSRALEKRQDKRPILSDLRDSGNLEQDADTVTFIYRDVVYNPDTDDPNLAELIMDKNRHGELGKQDLYWDRAITKFSNGVTRIIDMGAFNGISK